MVARSSVLYPPVYAPICTDIIVTWAKLDIRMEQIREAFLAQPECYGMASLPDQQNFKRRANNFHEMSRIFFYSCPALATFISKKYNDSVALLEIRNLVAHGTYGFQAIGDGTNITVKLMLTKLEKDCYVQSIYTMEELQLAANQIGHVLLIYSLISQGFSNDLDVPDYIRSRWKIPRAQVDKSQMLLSRIRDHCMSTTRRRYAQLHPLPP